MRAIILSFHNVNHDSMVASTKIARFVSEELDLPIVCDESIAEHGSLDALLIVNGAYAFCKFLPQTARAIRTARQIVWIQNDYTIVPPKPDSGAESPFRKAFRERESVGLPRIAYWSTVRDRDTGGPRSSYVNWNSLTFDESATEADIVQRRARASDAVLYYGAFRAGRRAYFDRYFSKPATQIVVADSGRIPKFCEHYKDPLVSHVGKIGDNFYDFLGTHRLGLYIEDKRSHSVFCSPANRFYEMLSAGLPMVFQPECGSMMRKAGFDPEPYYVRSARELAVAVACSEDILRRQRADWLRMDFRRVLRDQLQLAWRRTREVAK